MNFLAFPLITQTTTPQVSLLRHFTYFTQSL